MWTRRLGAVGWCAVLGASGAMGLASCAGDSGGHRGPSVEAEQSRGTLALPLTARGASGSLYRLRQAVFSIAALDPNGGTGGSGSGGFAGTGSSTGSGGFAGTFIIDRPVSGTGIFGTAGSFSVAGTGSSQGGAAGVGGGPAGSGGDPFFGFSTFLFSEDDPFATTLEATLPNGSYQIELFDGWFLEKVDAGEVSSVEATLLSPSAQRFDILTNQETRVSYRFETNGEIVDFGQGRLVVEIEVDEVAGESGPTLGEPLAVVDGLIDAESNAHGIQAALYSVAAPLGASISVTNATGAVCVTGDIAPVLNDDFATQWGAEFGFDFVGDDFTQTLPWDLDGGRATGFAFTVVGPKIPTQIRFRATPGGGDPGVDHFCLPLAVSSGQTVLAQLETLNFECWTGLSDPLLTRDLSVIGWNIPSDVASSHPFDFCIQDLRPILR